MIKKLLYTFYFATRTTGCIKLLNRIFHYNEFNFDRPDFLKILIFFNYPNAFRQT